MEEDEDEVLPSGYLELYGILLQGMNEEQRKAIEQMAEVAPVKWE